MQARNPNNAEGIDVSHYQGDIDWAQVKSAGISFAILKCTEGRSMVDTSLQTNFAGAKAQGIAVGVYHFFRATTPQEAVQEAQFFISVIDSIGGIEALDIAPFLDVEIASDLSKEDMAANIRAWMNEVEGKYKFRPYLYSYPGYMDNCIDNLSDYPLWIAYYSGTPDDRCGWNEWSFIQWTDGGTVPGIAGNVDRNEFNGSVEELMYKLGTDDANKVITFLAAAHGLATTDQDKAEFHRLANELRRASGQPVQ